jgi:putative membrane protein
MCIFAGEFYPAKIAFMQFIQKIFISAASIMLASYLLPGIHVSTFWLALLVALVLSLLNVFLKPLLVLITLPFTVVTLGLFLLVINAVIILIASAWIKEFRVDGFWWALLFSIIVSFITSLLEKLINPRHENPNHFR